MKDLKYLSNFLGIQAITHDIEITLTQYPYVVNILHRVDMITCNPIDHLIPSKTNPTEVDQHPFIHTFLTTSWSPIVSYNYEI